MVTYELQYCEEWYYPSVDGGFYGGLTICKEEFDSYAKMQDYIERNKIMWTENPNWSNMKYIIGLTISNYYRYEEVKQRLLELLETKKFENVTIIK